MFKEFSRLKCVNVKEIRNSSTLPHENRLGVFPACIYHQKPGLRKLADFGLIHYELVSICLAMSMHAVRKKDIGPLG